MAIRTLKHYLPIKLGISVTTQVKISYGTTEFISCILPFFASGSNLVKNNFIVLEQYVFLLFFLLPRTFKFALN